MNTADSFLPTLSRRLTRFPHQWTWSVEKLGHAAGARRRLRLPDFLGIFSAFVCIGVYKC